jgi:hypothetical protein
MEGIMSNRFIFTVGFAPLIALLVLAGCDAPLNPTAASRSDVPAGRAVAGAGAYHDVSDVYTWPPIDPEQIEGARATLVRNRNGARLNIQTRELEPGHTYSVWMVVFDAPEHCAEPYACGLDDIIPLMDDPGAENPSEATVFGAVGGGLAGGTGRAAFAGHAKPGDEANDVLFGDGSLDNPLTAEIHFVIRTHGPAIPGMIHEQISTFNGGCEEGEPNEGLCDDVQFGVFRSPEMT